MIITYAGAGIYAFASVVFSIVILLPFADLGVGAAVTNAAAEADHPHEDENLRRVLRTAARMLTASALALISIDAAMAVTNTWARLTGSAGGNIRSVNLVCFLAVGVFALGLPIALAQRLLLGTNRTWLLVLAQGSTGPVSLALVWGGTAFGVRASFLALALPIAMFVSLVLTWYAAAAATKVQLGQALKDVPHRRSAPGTSIRRSAMPMFVIVVAMPIALQTDRLILSHRAPVAAVATYSIAAQLFSPVTAVLSTVGSSFWPLFAKRRARGLDATGLFVGSSIAVTATAIAAGGAVIWAGPRIGSLLSGGQVTVPRLVLLAFSGVSLAAPLQSTVGAALTSPAGLRFQSRWVSAMTICNLGLSWWLAGSWGSAGPAAGSAITILSLAVVPNLIYFWRTESARAQPVNTRTSRIVPAHDDA